MLFASAALFYATAQTCPTCEFDNGAVTVTFDCDAEPSTYNCGYDYLGGTSNCACVCDGHFGADCKNLLISANNLVVLSGTCSDDTQAPTASPTLSPTNHPTNNPTLSPTANPTNSPT